MVQIGELLELDHQLAVELELRGFPPEGAFADLLAPAREHERVDVQGLSDLLNPAYGKDSLRYALMCTSLINLWAAAHFMLAGTAYAKEMAAKG